MMITGNIRHYEEELAKSHLTSWIKKECMDDPTFTYEPYGYSRPPDFLIEFGSRSILLEVCRSGDGFILSNNINGERIASEEQGASLEAVFKKILNLFLQDSFLNNGETLICAIKNDVPLKGRGRIAQKIYKELKDSYQLNKIPCQVFKETRQKHVIQVGNICIDVFLTRYYEGRAEYSPVKFISASSLNTCNFVEQASIENQVQYVLSKFVCSKSEKLRKMDGEKWLCIVNTHPLLGIASYKDAMLNDRINHDFFKIFLIDAREEAKLFVLL